MMNFNNFPQPPYQAQSQYPIGYPQQPQYPVQAYNVQTGAPIQAEVVTTSQNNHGIFSGLIGTNVPVENNNTNIVPAEKNEVSTTKKKSSKKNTMNEAVKDDVLVVPLYQENESKKKKSAVPMIVIMAIMFVLVLVGMYNWRYAFNVDIFEKSYESMMGVEVNGYLKITKSSNNPEITNENNCYSLSGAKYGVYSNSACTSLAATLTTTETGSSNTVSLPIGNYWIKEISASTGYLLDTNVYSTYVSGNNTSSNPVNVAVKEMPANDPAPLYLYKIDQETGGVYTQGAASLEGAEFTLKFYAGHYDEETLPEEEVRQEIRIIVETPGKVYPAIPAGLRNRFVRLLRNTDSSRRPNALRRPEEKGEICLSLFLSCSC